jgi:SHNi-TPR
MLLADLSSENDAFTEALEDYRLALGLLSSHLPEASQPRSFKVRRSACIPGASLTSLRPCSPYTQKHVRRATPLPICLGRWAVERPGPYCLSVSPQGQQPPVRRLAELHYKASLALQFLHKAGPAKEHTEV